jgi:hypothetical protein
MKYLIINREGDITPDIIKCISKTCMLEEVRIKNKGGDFNAV